ncbi:MAG: hypothetical protein A2231_12790 [Candidatus Firestonebacteria bacterium RIFOXYA2_FULL_40_8]|nr:MAG: hypothetical protein A2231_12790 [Candidatus Firestonebacteria bacterium RIFOXYA2_FULL_40_8]
MKNKLAKINKRFYIAVFSMLFLLLDPTLAHADVGVPMIFLTFPAMLIALIPVIIIEAIVFTKILKIKFRATVLPSAFANIVSTIIGIPLSWLLMVEIQMNSGGGGAYGLYTIWRKVISVTWQAAWLIPYEGDLWWMVPIAAAVGLIPAYFLSILIEYFIVKMFFKKKNKVKVKQSIVKGNLLTYGLLLLCCMGMFVYQLATHDSESNFIWNTPERKAVELTKKIKLQPKDHSLYYERSNVWCELNKTDNAIRDLNKAIELNPRYEDAYSLRGNIYFNKGEYDKAIKDYDSAIKIDPNWVRMYSSRGEAYKKVGKIEESENDLKMAKKLDKNEHKEDDNIFTMNAKLISMIWKMTMGYFHRK